MALIDAVLPMVRFMADQEDKGMCASDPKAVRLEILSAYVLLFGCAVVRVCDCAWWCEGGRLFSYL